MLSLRRSCSSASTSARTPRHEHARAAATIRRIFEHLVDERGDDAERDRPTIVAGMTDRFALAFAAVHLAVPRIKDTLGRGGQAGGRHRRRSSRTHAAAQGRRHATRAAARSTRSARRASRSTPAAASSTTASAAAQGGDAITFVTRRRASTSSARSNGSRSASASSSSTRRLAGGGGSAAGASGCYAAARAGDRVLRALPLGQRAGPLRARVPRSRAASHEEICREFRLGLAPGGTTLDEGAREGLLARGAARGRAREPSRQRLLPAPAALPARRRARPGASASRRASCTRTTRCRRST